MAERRALTLSLCLLLVGCGAKTAETPAESKTNWLEACDSDAQCGSELACHCGVCTKNCADASCPGALECLGTCGGQAPSCQAQCTTNADCEYLSANARCGDGLCRIDGEGLSANQVTNASPTPEISDEQFEAARVPTGQAALADDTGGAFRVIEVPAASTQPSIVKSPLGWLALSSRQLGDARAPSGYESVLYRSTDGVHWESLPFDLPHDDVELRSLAYGNGRYVMVGRKLAAGGVIWSSDDAEHWTELAQTGDVATQWGQVMFAGSHFFAPGFRNLGVSQDGLSWSSVPITIVQVEAIAHGNDRYVMVGSGPVEVSLDGFTWEAHDLDCSLPGACDMTPPTPLGPNGEPSMPGQIIQGYHPHVLFAEGRFFIAQLSSADGITWEAMPDRFPTTYVAEHFLGSVSLTEGLPSWVTAGPVEALRVVRPTREASTQARRELLYTGVLDREAPLPDRVEVEFEDGVTCETAACILVDGKLVLVPPVGTPPLPDRVPRQANGAPLFSDDCPVSSQLFCEDYEAREGCRCEPEAPRSPESCDDVGQYQCQGAFAHREGEWELEELREGGCDCNYVDPNQPAGFGVNCAADMTVCIAPLQCLPLPPIASVGPPYQPYVCTQPCTTDADCPSWEATGFCAGPVSLHCAEGSCEPRTCN